MRVIVTGATGNVGTSVVRSLVADPRITSVVGVARRSPSSLPDGVLFTAADVTKDDLGPVVDGADAVVHLAWRFQPTHRPMVTWTANAIGSIRVFEAAAAAGVGAVVHASSVGAYSPGPADGRPVDETWPTHSRPTSAYGREKAYVERVLDAFELAHPSMRVVRMRPAFIFQRASATEQRRIFAGPFLPRAIVRPGTLPVLPYPTGLRLQALHSADVADAFRRAAVGDVRGAFNLAAEPVLDGPGLAAVLGARPVRLPRWAVRSALAAAWHARVVPADPALLDLFLDLPMLDSSRARDELGWVPQHSGPEAIVDMLHGMADGAGGPTAPLAPDRLDRRVAEVASS